MPTDNSISASTAVIHENLADSFGENNGGESRR
jgi:hypothetical protein